mmetsp:Transcript_133238/g.265822  ORF Transcript_133238/g.265822 Transcript_133238/m.265822 type:complete len:468 (+) Transcript_133238:88-1491(+)
MAESRFLKGLLLANMMLLPFVSADVPVKNVFGSIQAGSGSFLLQKESVTGSRRASPIHWVFVTDCSAYMFNEGNLLLASAHAVQQEGAFTWIVYGCQRDDQRKALGMLAHPTANVWFSPEVNLTDPETGEQFEHFQASNRPVSVQAWYEATSPQEDAIAIIDPDMLFLRPVQFTSDPHNGPAGLHTGPWQTLSAAPKLGVGALYGQGCQSNRWTEEIMKQVCGSEIEACLEASRDDDACTKAYSSGPPWITHKSDAQALLSKFPITTLRVHQVWPNLLSEQVAYGVTQMRNGIATSIDPFWFLSSPEAGHVQPWAAVAELDFDPCQKRQPPPPDASNPIFFHACSTFHLHNREGTGYTLHKDHIHKDLLDCDSPLLRYPPEDSLEEHKGNKDSDGFRATWAVCTYTNLVNAYARSWKDLFCKNPNLEATFAYPAISQGFLNQTSWLASVFRKGGWSDIDYYQHINKI